MLYLRWQDDYLDWTGLPYSQYYTGFTAQLPAGIVWVPAVTLINSANIAHTIAFANNTALKVTQKGVVSAVLYTQLISSCDIDSNRCAEQN